MVNDPHDIADSMVEEHGLDRAIDIAVEETQLAHNAGDNYRVSEWREIKWVLRERKIK